MKWLKEFFKPRKPTKREIEKKWVRVFIAYADLYGMSYDYWLAVKKMEQEDLQRNGYK